MNTNVAFTFATDVLALIGESPAKISFLAKGATCTVWLVQSACQKSYALRIIDQDDRVIDGASDQFIRHGVVALSGRVGAFVLSSETSQMPLQGKRWGLDAFIAGSHPERGALPDIVCRQLGETLAVLHQLPVRNFGQLSGVKNGVGIGRQTTALEAVKQRFENPLPETWQAGFNHPILTARPELAGDILARLATVTAAIAEQRPVICHTDLHEKQLLCTKDGLAALIDFGGAAILDRHWDLGSVYYFHGKENFAELYQVYLNVTDTQENQTDLVASFSVAIAMHHASRSRLPGKHHRLNVALDHIERVITGL